MIEKIISNGGKITIKAKGAIKASHHFFIEDNEIGELCFEMKNGFVKGFYRTIDACYEITKSDTEKDVLQVNRYGNNIAELKSKFNLKGLLNGNVITSYRHYYSVSTKGLLRPTLFLTNEKENQTVFSISQPNIIRTTSIEVFPSLINIEEFNALLAISSFRMLATIVV